MELNNYVGPILAVTVFVTIGIGHVAVRYLNYHLGTKPGIPLFIIGFSLLIYTMYVPSDLWSSVVGIIGMTTVWDGIEMYRQEKRIINGHAPENPKRPVKKK
ncbi:MAG TPA: hypothetical protein DEO36_06975 [Flavobacteriaceae bacterium]|jgi:hypothetical protein|nr:hypothetical protein [Flavobacteriaceae bacterium]